MHGCRVPARLEHLSPVGDVVEELLLEHGVSSPPVDALALAARMGLEVLRDASMEVRGRLVRRENQAMICVRSEPRLERDQWTIAHEIGEYLFERLAEAVREDPIDGRLRERLANAFASLLLTPPSWWRRAVAAAEGDLFELKGEFSTASFEVLATRLLDEWPASVITIVDQGRVTRRVGNLPSPPPPLLGIEREARQSAHDACRVAHRRGEGLWVRAWPIHEPGWRREIVHLTRDPAADDFSDSGEDGAAGFPCDDQAP